MSSFATTLLLYSKKSFAPQNTTTVTSKGSLSWVRLAMLGICRMLNKPFAKISKEACKVCVNVSYVAPGRTIKASIRA